MRRRLGRFAIAIVTLTAVMATTSHATPSRIAVIVQVAVNVPDVEADSIAAALATSLTRITGVAAIGGPSVRPHTAHLSDECLVTNECVAALAKTLAVDSMVTAAMVRVGTELQLDVALIDPATGSEISRARVQVAANDVLADRLDGISAALLPSVTVSDPIATPMPPPPPASRSHRHMTTSTWIATAAATAGLATAAGFGWSTRDRFQACQARDVCSSASRDDIARRALVADVTLGIGITAIGFAAWRYWVSAAPNHGEVQVAPVRGGAVVGYAGQF